MKALIARTRCSMPAESLRHSEAAKTRGMMSKGIRRSAASSSPYTANVMPWRRKRASAARLARSTSAFFRLLSHSESRA
jgi:hypothetical protein